MGKGNRVRLNKAQEAANNQSVFNAKTQKKQTPAWVMTLVLALVVALLVSCVALTVINENGYVLRWKQVVESEHYSFNGTMMSYLFYQNYSDFLTTYGSVASYLGLDTTKSLKDQQAMSGGTWYDYFMDPAIATAEEILVYCEEARVRGIELDDEDFAEIDAVIDAITESAKTNNYTLNAYISALYGSGVKVKDIRAALELSQLGSKCYEIVSEEFENGITADDISKYADENPSSVLTADYLSYSVTIKNEDGVDYEAEKAKADALTAKLEAAVSEEEFKKAVIEYIATEDFDSVYTEKAKAYDSSKLPDEATLAEKKQAIIASVIANVISGKNVDKNSSTEVADILFYNVQLSLESSAENAVIALLTEGEAFTPADTEDASAAALWLSETGRKAGDTKSFPEEDKEANPNTYTTGTYMVVRPMERDTTPSRDVAHILFTSDTYKTAEEAEKKAEEILAQYKAGEQTYEAFEKLAEQYTEDSGISYESVIPSQMVEEFENWLFDSARKAGDTDIVESEYGFHLMYFIGENTDELAWQVISKSAIHSERIGEWTDEKYETFKITVNEDAAQSISA